MPVKIPICVFDAKTGILCGKCEAKLKSGQIRESDIHASRALVQLAEKVPELNKATLHRSFEVQGNYLLEFEEADLVAFRANQEIVQRLESLLKGKVWVAGASSSDRRFLEDIFYPVRLSTVNVVWLPDGSKLTKVIVGGGRGELRAGDLQILKRVVKEVKGIELTVESEREATLRL